MSYHIRKFVLSFLIIGLPWALFMCENNQKLVAGKDIYQKYCTSCHGVDGSLSINAAIDLSHSRLSMEGRIEIIKKGRVTMTGFDQVLSEAQIDSVARYTLKLQQ